MRTVIDISDGGRAMDDAMPEPTLIDDDGDMLVTFGEVEIRMTYGQFFELHERMTAWMQPDA